MTTKPFLVATSSCLVGNPVRYDGTDKKHQAMLNYLSDVCQFEAVCPEHLAFGTPRPTIDVVINQSSQVRVLTSISSDDVTERLQASIEQVIERLSGLPLTGMILKARSPSCGLGSAPYYQDGVQVSTGDGLFVRACRNAFPGLPMIDESELNDLDVIKAFVAAMTSYDPTNV